MTQAPDISTTPHITVRQAAPAELGTIHDLTKAAGLSTERNATTATLDGCTYWAADPNGVPAGCIGLEHGERRGLGRALGMSALTYATLRGNRVLYLFGSGSDPLWQQFGCVPAQSAEVLAALPARPRVGGGEARSRAKRQQAWKRVIGA